MCVILLFHKDKTTKNTHNKKFQFFKCRSAKKPSIKRDYHLQNLNELWNLQKTKAVKRISKVFLRDSHHTRHSNDFPKHLFPEHSKELYVIVFETIVRFQRFFHFQNSQSINKPLYSKLIKTISNTPFLKPFKKKNIHLYKSMVKNWYKGQF